MNEKHPIQLKEILIKSLSFTRNSKPKSLPPEDRELNIEIREDIYVGLGIFEEEKSILPILLGFKQSSADESMPAPYDMTVEIIGQFIVDLNGFDKEHLESWGKSNAPTLLMPFLREQVYALSLRAGIEPKILPLITVPMSNS